MIRYTIFLSSLLLFILSACKKEKPTAAQQHEISSVSGPSTGNINTDIILTVTYPYINGCDYVAVFEESKTGNTVILKAISKTVPKNAVCTQDVGSRTIDYPFKSATAGVFELKFLKLDQSAITHTITIQQ
jgi:hypothetical protein